LNAGVPQTLWRALWKNGKSDNTRHCPLFVERLVGMGHGKAGNAAIHSREALEETMEEKARGIVKEFLKTRGMGLDEFRSLRKGHPDKIALAAELRQSNTMTMAWIAEELNAGVPQTLWRVLWKNGKSDNTRD
jgi:hypothetical protein